MKNDSSGKDPRAIWISQPMEPSTMTLEMIRQRARELQAKTRSDLVKSVAGPLIVIAICAFGMQISSPQPTNPALRAALLLAVAWSLTGQYFLHRGMWSPLRPEDVALKTGLESYRQEIERRRSLFSRSLLWGSGPIMLALTTLILILVRLSTQDNSMPLGHVLTRMGPFLALSTIWTAAVFVMRMRQRQELQREANELNDLAKRTG